MAADDKPFTDVTYKVIGPAMEVHNTLGPGMKEVFYHRSLSKALSGVGLAFEDEVPIRVMLDEAQAGLLFLDHLVEGSVVVDEKALPYLLTAEVAQVINFLAASQAPVGLLVNFGHQRLEYKRIFPPKKFSDWQNRAKRYAWRPDAGRPNPIIRSESVDDSTSAYDAEVPV